ncbi:MAG TPA: helix-turn-helix domain-containing GNAT family N-acetyltransferase [Acidobacteriaceae bacterium]|nr:helix-turn-helix domain-containing GNAT family N-acetyltransferase [Acidobacteriaceae bacterium]
MPESALAADAAAFRQFNRVYTRFIGTVTERFLQTQYSLAEGRVLYELATQSQPRAKAIAEALDLDAGYLSRIVTRFEKAGLVSRRAAKADSRASDLILTARGRAAFRTLNTRAEKQARDVLEPMSPSARAQFIGAMRTIENVVQPRESALRPFTLRTHRPGDMGMVVGLEGAGYVEQFGWDGTFEALVARIVADFLTTYDSARERCWIAEIQGRHVGHVFLVRHPDEPGTAKLRLLYVDPLARGLGLGHALVAECVQFARVYGYGRITLWTQSILQSAHRIYQGAGFRLVREEPHHSFGQDLTGQTWELKLN